MNFRLVRRPLGSIETGAHGSMISGTRSPIACKRSRSLRRSQGRVRTVGLMTISWICASCRRQILVGVKATIEPVYAQKASFISFNHNTNDGPSPSDDHAITDRLASRRRPPGRRKSFIRVIPLDYERSVEDDFVQRILEHRDPSSGPYSNPASLLAPDNVPGRASLSHAWEAPDVPRSGIFKPDIRPRPTYRVPNPPPEPYDHTAHSKMYLRSQVPVKPFETSLEDPTTSKDVRSTSTATSVSAIVKEHIISNLKSTGLRGGSGYNEVFDGPRTEPPTRESDEPLKTQVQESLSASSQQQDLDQAEPSSVFTPDSDTRMAWEAYLQDTPAVRAFAQSSSIFPFATTIVEDWCRARDGSGLPNPTTVCQILTKLQDQRGFFMLWRACITGVLHYMISQRAGKWTHTGRSRQNTLNEVVALWGCLFERHGECYVSNEQGVIQLVRSIVDWSAFATSEQTRQIQSTKSPNSLPGRLNCFFDKSLHKHFNEVEAISMLTTCTLLREKDTSAFGTNNRADQRSLELQVFLGHLLASATIAPRLSKYQAILQKRGVQPAHCEPLFARITEHVTEAVSPSANNESVPQVLVEHGEAPPAAKSHKFDTDLFRRRIGRAIERRNEGALERLWSEAQASFANSNSEHDKTTYLPPELFVHFLMGSMALRRPESAIDIWNAMSRQGVQPGVEHWDAMLKGCSAAQDISSLRRLWSKMLESGVTPDARLWITRIHGLVSSRRYNAAFDAFKDMARAWIDESKASRAPKSTKHGNSEEAKDTPTKPNIQCLNALVGGLARARRYEQLGEALSWLKPLQLTPDIYTFNPLFKSALMDGDIELATKFLQQMQALGIEANVATFTMILDSLFRGHIDSVMQTLPSATVPEAPTDSPATESPATILESNKEAFFVQNHVSDQQAVGAFFGLMAKHSVRPTAHTFSTLVKGLLNLQVPNVTAAYSVLKHLTVQSMPLAPQIYTSLANHHFKQSPPDLGSVDALWHHAKAQRKRETPLVLDEMFYDTFVRGWAKAGECGKAYQAWESATRQGCTSSDETQRILGSGLEESGDWAKAKQLVQSIQRRGRTEGITNARDSSHKGFWSSGGRTRVNGFTAGNEYEHYGGLRGESAVG